MSFTHQTGVVSFIAWVQVRVVPSCSDVIVEDSIISRSNLCGFKKQCVSILIKIERVPRDAMHAHTLASPSSADELTKHLTELNGFRSLELEDAGRDRVPKCPENRIGEWLNLESRNFGARGSREAGVWWIGSC